MGNNSFDQLLRDSYEPQLPYGFAERVARIAMGEKQSSVWDWLMSFSPRLTLATGLAAAALFVVGMTGSGPNLLQSVENFASLKNIIQLP